MPHSARRTILAAASIAATIATTQPAAAFLGGSAADVERARANARAGGPVSEHDRDLLERWGCLSGTRSPACEPRARAYDASPPQRRVKRRR